ncbi:MAG: hypothetical protein GWO00_20380, partial [Gemmatimonadetes bacterium]|nr:hypothetical protein [Gemmatimonadota bacterium]NIR80624.1 hypothetical protein [Gemmatimonadota bacterium]NIT89411.1 hypothetical protein [Gemmatimonadota bacterium]NIU33215.1 hypothetical protein [Gemmatimonadota bacterium]NIV63556.1 hypothetical protein [Gemmatimonadota bacterium]
MLRTLSSLAVLTLAISPAVSVPSLVGQDVEMLGERYGTPVPEGYERTRRADPTAFELSRGLHGGRGVELRSYEGGSGEGLMLSL